MNPVQENINRFREAHGESISDGAWEYFEDGAVRERNPQGPMFDPPQDKHELARNITFFWKQKVRLAEEAFIAKKDELKGALRGSERGLAPPPPGTREQVNAMLKKLQQEVLRCREKLAEAQTSIESSTPQHIVDRNRERRESWERLRESLADVDDIKI